MFLEKKIPKNVADQNLAGRVFRDLRFDPSVHQIPSFGRKFFDLRIGDWTLERWNSLFFGGFFWISSFHQWLEIQWFLEWWNSLTQSPPFNHLGGHSQLAVNVGFVWSRWNFALILMGFINNVKNRNRQSLGNNNQSWKEIISTRLCRKK